MMYECICMYTCKHTYMKSHIDATMYKCNNIIGGGPLSALRGAASSPRPRRSYYY